MNSATLTTLLADFRNRARTRLVQITDVLAQHGARGGALLRQADLLGDTLDLLATPYGLTLPEGRLRVLLERVAGFCGLSEIALVADPNAPLPLPLPAPYPTPIFLGGAPAALLPAQGLDTTGKVLTSSGVAGREFWSDPASRVVITGITEFRDRFGPSFEGTAEQALRTLLVRYQAPAFTGFQLDGQGSQVLEVGTVFAQIRHTFTWSISNPANVAPASLVLRDLTEGEILASGLANDGVETVDLAGFAVFPGESRRYRLSARDTQGNVLAAELTIAGAYRLFYGPVASAPVTPADVRALPASQLAPGGAQLTLNTGASARTFCLWLPAGRQLVAAVDVDALGANLLGQYAAAAQAAPDAGGTLVPGTLYTMTQAVPYASSHRHLLTIA